MIGKGKGKMCVGKMCPDKVCPGKIYPGKRVLRLGPDEQDRFKRRLRKLKQPYDINLSKPSDRVPSQALPRALIEVFFRNPDLFMYIAGYIVFGTVTGTGHRVVPRNMLFSRGVMTDVLKIPVTICDHHRQRYHEVSPETLRQSIVFNRDQLMILCLPNPDVTYVNFVDIIRGINEAIRMRVQPDEGFAWTLVKISYVPSRKDFIASVNAQISSQRGNLTRVYNFHFWANEDGGFISFDTGRYNVLHDPLFERVGCCA